MAMSSRNLSRILERPPAPSPMRVAVDRLYQQKRDPYYRIPAPLDIKSPGALFLIALGYGLLILSAIIMVVASYG